ATGQHCPEGWSFYPEPLPQIQGVTDRGSAEASYYTWVDQVGVLGLGQNVPINTGNGSEGLLVFQDGKWIVLRVPYPFGFYTKWMDGRIDDPTAGWKGRELWATVSTRAPFHMEGGKGTTSKVLKFQLRPDRRPLAPPQRVPRHAGRVRRDGRRGPRARHPGGGAHGLQLLLGGGPAGAPGVVRARPQRPTTPAQRIHLALQDLYVLAVFH